MNNEIDLFKNYTTTSMLANQDEAKLTKWSIGYFKACIAPHLPSDRECRILEIGCGYGRNLLALKMLGYTDVYGIDISEEQIEYSKDKLGLTNTAMCDTLNFLEDKAQKYDVILLLDVLEHLELNYSIKLIQLIKYSLSPDGLFIIQVPNALAPLSPIRYADITHLRAYTVSSIEQHLRLGGFKVMDHFELPPYIYNTSSLIRKILWFTILKPVIASYMLVVNSSLMGGIYTTNLLTVAHHNKAD